MNDWPRCSPLPRHRGTEGAGPADDDDDVAVVAVVAAAAVVVVVLAARGAMAAGLDQIFVSTVTSRRIDEGEAVPLAFKAQ
jgi:hypothetical protein